MVDFDKSTGSTGTMRIRDTGTTVEFWINSGNSSTYNSNMPWAYVDASGSSGWLSYNYQANAGWERIRSWNVNTTQTVTFKLGDTGTSGLGGPTNLSAVINRASPPAAPATPTISNLGATSFTATAANGSSNGATISARQFARNTSNTLTGATTFRSDASTVYTFTGLTPGTTYYVWARAQNSEGWGPWSGVRSATTLRTPDAPDPVILSGVTQVSVKASFVANGNGGSNINAMRIGYGTSSTAPTSYATYVGGAVITIAGLTPATTYYFWAQAQNSTGWSPLSEVRTIRTIAGAWVETATGWVEAVPYVKDAGTWKLARPWGRQAGVWKETT